MDDTLVDADARFDEATRCDYKLQNDTFYLQIIGFIIFRLYSRVKLLCCECNRTIFENIIEIEKEINCA